MTDKSIFIVQSKNLDELISTPSGIANTKDFDLVSASFPLFFNIGPTLENNKITVDITEFTIPTGHYNSLVDLCLQLVAVTGLTFTYDSITKKITISSGVAFSIDDCEILNYMLGFGEDSVDGSASSYTSTQMPDLFPFTQVLIDVSTLPQRTYINNTNSTTFSFPFNVFDFLSKSTTKFEITDYSYGLYSKGGTSGNRFPMRVTARLLKTSGSVVNFPLGPTERITLTFRN